MYWQPWQQAIFYTFFFLIVFTSDNRFIEKLQISFAAIQIAEEIELMKEECVVEPNCSLKKFTALEHAVFKIDLDVPILLKDILGPQEPFKEIEFNKKLIKVRNLVYDDVQHSSHGLLLKKIEQLSKHAVQLKNLKKNFKLFHKIIKAPICFKVQNFSVFEKVIYVGVSDNSDTIKIMFRNDDLF